MTRSTHWIPAPQTPVTRWQRARLVVAVSITLAFVGPAVARGQSTTARAAAPLTLRRLVDPATRVEVNGQTVPFALHGFVRFETLNDLFMYIDEQAGRWTFATTQARHAFGDDLLQRGVESRIVSMQTELPLEIVLTHTRREVTAAVNALHTADPSVVFTGRHWRASMSAYRAAFLRVRDRWSTSLNCWSS